ncbi:hypothetical protein [Parvularcula lutaonensis]|uniref:EAL domain-containing protein n=1 Tax=Parvularcula lutaonensis TaxID=491923 RepID=A0ABV7MEJ8_9PROT|nr:hypothetical protein [Parvularcula lutaonensis]GGY54908.1 hypothetical protein GCM10007148_25820 [Parvularcula lutaonensis]
MGDLGNAFSFDRYADLLARRAAMDPSGFSTVETATLGALAVGALGLFVLIFARRSGTAAAGFALVVLTALSEAVLFGGLDFVTPGTKTLIGSLTASALLLFVNAVLHTGRENLLVAGISAVVIGILLSLGGATVAGFGYAAEAQLAMLAATALSAGLLVFAMVRDPRGKAFLGLSVLLAILASLLMIDPVAGSLQSMMPVVTPIVAVAAGILLATLSAPFVADDIRVPSRSERRAAEAGQYRPVSLFNDDGSVFDDVQRSPRAREPRERPEPRFSRHESQPAQAFDAPPTFPQEPYEPAAFEAAAAATAAGYAESGDPVSNYWHQDPAGAVLEAEHDEYIWDALAQPEVRAGDDVLRALHVQRADDLTPEGLRSRLAPEALRLFDEEVLGGSDPVSGPFDVTLQTGDARFQFRGRRQVDHDGVLMRLDAAVTGIQPLSADQPAQLEAPSYADVPSHFRPVALLRDQTISGFEIGMPPGPLSEDVVKETIDEAASILKDLMQAGEVKGPFAILDASALDLRPGQIAAAVGKAVRVHELPRGALLVGVRLPANKDMKSFALMADDIRKAGGGIAFIVDDPRARPVKGIQPQMVWVDASDVMTRKRGRKSAIDAIARKFEAPVLVRELRDPEDASDAREDGALFGVGNAFRALHIPLPEQRGHGSLAAPRGGVSSLRANGLR